MTLGTSTVTAPVALFAYIRPVHLSSTVESLRANPEAAHTALTVFCDAPKRSEHAAGVEAVRAYARTIEGFASLEIVERPTNLGLAASIIDGVTRLTATQGRVIVVEDDLLLSRNFLRYMNDGLDTYANDDRVASIHGYCYPVAEPLPETFFLRGADCWGWATWQRAWTQFRPDGRTLLAELESRRLTRAFDLDGQYGFTRMLRGQIAGRNDSWAVRWHASCYLADLLTLYPGRSLVHNIGNDASGTHSRATEEFAQSLATTAVHVQRQPTVESAQARSAFVRFFRAAAPSPARRILRAARHFLRQLA